MLACKVMVQVRVTTKDPVRVRERDQKPISRNCSLASELIQAVTARVRDQKPISRDCSLASELLQAEYRYAGSTARRQVNVCAAVFIQGSND